MTEEKDNDAHAELLDILRRELGLPDGEQHKNEESDGSMEAFHKWETEIYPQIWWEAYAYGESAREEELPRECNLSDPQFISGKTILRVYKSAWEQGYDGYKIPAIFGQMEAVVNELPLRPMK